MLAQPPSNLTRTEQQKRKMRPKARGSLPSPSRSSSDPHCFEKETTQTLCFPQVHVWHCTKKGEGKGERRPCSPRASCVKRLGTTQKPGASGKGAGLHSMTLGSGPRNTAPLLSQAKGPFQGQGHLWDSGASGPEAVCTRDQSLRPPP